MAPDHTNYENASCHYFSGGRCRSCPLLQTPPGSRLTTKLALLTSTLVQFDLHPKVLRDAVAPPSPWHTRHKVKMSISGPLEKPVVGITRQDRSSEELIGCELSTEPIQKLLRHLPRFISTHSLTPYDIASGTGELKFVIVMTTKDHNQGIVRFVLRSTELVPLVRAAAHGLQAESPWIKVISCNIQPIPAAILEGPEEIPITKDTLIRDEFDTLPLYFAPQSFMQVTPSIAQQLYTRASQIVAAESPDTLLDLFCGVGGFTLSAAAHCGEAIGVEISQQAISCAQRSAQELGFQHVRFQAAGVEDFLQNQAPVHPDIVIVNPPRRGLSKEVVSYLMQTKPRTILYSSCNPETFARDAQALSSRYSLEELTPFDMFPMTNHWEVLGLFKA
jgi:23S rRNA (uracil747-C5)-methyltransferase